MKRFTFKIYDVYFGLLPLTFVVGIIFSGSIKSLIVAINCTAPPNSEIKTMVAIVYVYRYNLNSYTSIMNRIHNIDNVMRYEIYKEFFPCILFFSFQLLRFQDVFLKH